jgi:hypothetical protein
MTDIISPIENCPIHLSGFFVNRELEDDCFDYIHPPTQLKGAGIRFKDFDSGIIYNDFWKDRYGYESDMG